jgi:hypothetical protein
MEALVQKGEPAVDPLINALEDEDLLVRNAATEALVQIGEPAVGPLIGFLIDEDDGLRVRDAAIEALVQIGEPAVGALIEALRDEDRRVLSAAVRTLVKIGEPAVGALVDALRDEEEIVRKAAVRALAQIGDPVGDPAGEALFQNGEPAVGAFIEALGVESLGNRFGESTLVQICYRDPFILLPYLKKSSTIHVYPALIRCGNRETVEALVEALNKHGDKKMAEHYLNCGNKSLENAAKQWAQVHGYTVVINPGGGGGPRWGK